MSIMFPRRRQGGFAIFAAVFILVVLALLGAAIATVSSHQHTGAALDVQGRQAYQAARAGIEWGLYQVLQADGSACTGKTSLDGGASLQGGFTVSVECPAVTGVSEPGVQNWYTVTAWACNRPQDKGGIKVCPGAQPAAPGYVERKMVVLAEKPVAQ